MGRRVAAFAAEILPPVLAAALLLASRLRRARRRLLRSLLSPPDGRGRRRLSVSHRTALPAAALVPGGRIRRRRGRILTGRELAWFAVSAMVTLGLVAIAPTLGIPLSFGQPEPVAVFLRATDSPSLATASPPAERARALPRTEPYRIVWPFEITDGLTFGPEGAIRTRLAGLEGPPRDAVCSDRDGRPWACGLQARAALNNITRRQDLDCEPVGPSDGEVVVARCRGEVDVARELVLAGFARSADRDPALEAAEDEARREGRGLWNGGWTVRIAAR